MCAWLLLRRVSACEAWFNSPPAGLWLMPRPPFLRVPVAHGVWFAVV